MALEELRLIEEQIANWTSSWPVWSVSIKMLSSGWRKCPVWEWTPRSCRLGPSARESS